MTNPLGFPTNPRSVITELYVNYTWVDISGDVYARDGVTISRGRRDETSRAEPSSCHLTVNNRSGNYSPRNPTGLYFGSIGRNTPIRVGVQLVKDTFTRAVSGGWGSADTGQGYTVTGAGGSVFTTDWNVASGTGTMSTPVANAYRFAYLPGISLRDVDITGQVVWPFTTVTGGPLESGLMLRGATGGNYTYAKITIQTDATVQVSIYSSDGTVIAADAVAVGITYTGQPLRVRAQAEGSVYRFKVWPAGGLEPYGWHVTVRSTVNSAAGWAGVRSGVVFGNTNTLPVVASWDNISVRVPRFFGEVASWPQRFDASGVDVYVPVEAAGLKRRLNQGAAPVTSTLRRGLTNLAIPPVAYWPCEDGASATSFASAVGGSPLLYSGTLKPAAYNAIPSSAPILTMGITQLNGRTPYYAPTGYTQLRYVINMPSSEPPDLTALCDVFSFGTAASWRIRFHTGGVISIESYDAYSNKLLDSGNYSFGVTGKNLMMSLELTQSGSNVNWAFKTLEVGASLGLVISGTLVGYTATAFYYIRVDPSSLLNGVSIGHINIRKEVTNLFDLSTQFNAYAGEFAIDRMVRLCAQESIPFQYLDGGVTSTALGPQLPLPVLTLLDEAATADLGTLHEPRGALGLIYRSRSSLYNQNTTLILDYSLGQVAPPLEPVDDDQLTRNDVTVTRTNGSSARGILTSGSLSVLDPFQGGVGRYYLAVTLNLATDDQLPDFAGWLLLVGTVNESRYPAITCNLASPNMVTAGLDQATLTVDVDDQIYITNPAAAVSYNSIVQIARGYTETLNVFEHKIVFNCSPNSPYWTAALFDTLPYKLDSGSSSLSAGTNATATTFSVSVTSGPLWTTDPTQMPIWINVAGEEARVTAVSGASSPQTFTVVRSTNGVTKTQAVGNVVQLTRPYQSILGL